MSKLVIPLPLAGGCQCGEIRYEITSQPKALYACHCTECQQQSSASFGLSMPVDRTGLQLQIGVLKTWTRESASGRRVDCAFCPNCGTRIYHAPERNPEIFNVKPGTLDNTKWLVPVAHLWVTSAQPWVQVPNDVIRYPKQPETFEPIFQAWQALLGKPSQRRFYD